MAITADRWRPDRAYLSTNLCVPKSAVNVQGVKNALTFTYYEGREERQLHMYRELPHHIEVPREFWDPNAFNFEVVDCRPQTYPKANIRSRIQLDHKYDSTGRLVPTGTTTQRDALNALLAARGGILQLACGKGKTIIALELIARLATPALIVVDNTTLMAQWKREIDTFLEIPGGVGLIQAGVFDWKKSVVLATYHTLAARADTMEDEVRRWFGIGIFDESHHVNAPVFSKGGDLLYGRRVGLTATPVREDGLHVVAEVHFGRVIYKDLLQELRPRIIFEYTDLEPDFSDPLVVDAISAKNGELNLGKMASYFGQWRPHLDLVHERIKEYVAQGRKILVLSHSVSKLVNLLALWNNMGVLFSDIPVPTKEEVGEDVDPMMLDPARAIIVQDSVEATKVSIKHYADQGRTMAAAEQQRLLDGLLFQLKQHQVAKKIESLLNKRQSEYIKDLLSMPSNAGLIIRRVPVQARMAMLSQKQVTFAIAKYGREGLDSKELDTAILCEPVGSKNSIQQMTGRVLRPLTGKKQPIFHVFEDKVVQLIAMCKKMRKLFRSWPIDEGGPFTYEFKNNPTYKGRTP